MAKDDRDRLQHRKRRSATIKDIANSLGLAHSTVSRALNDHPSTAAGTKELVRRAASKMHYVPNSGARLMQSGTTKLVGIIVPDVQNDFYSAATEVLAKHCSAEGYQLILAVSQDDPEKERQQVQALREARVAGVVIAASAVPDPETVRLLRGVATVQFLRYHPAIVSASVVADEQFGLHAATAHLLSLGHHRVGYIGVSEKLSTGLGRVKGYEQALNAASVKLDPSLVQIGPAQPMFGGSSVDALLDLPDPPSALVVASPRLTLGALQAIRRRGLLLPRDLSLVAYSDTEWFDAWEPGITAVALPIEEMAAAAAARLFHQFQLTSKAALKSSPFPTVLRVRGSCMSIRAQR